MAGMQEKQLGQLRPSTTAATSIYSPAASTTFVIKTLHVVNTGAGNRTYKVYHDEDGTTYDSDSIILTGNISGNSSVLVESLWIAGSNSSGNIAVETSSANALNFTIYGVEIT